MTDIDLIEHVLNNSPERYEISVFKLEDRIGNSTNPVTIDQLRNKLNLKYERIKERNDCREKSKSNYNGKKKIHCFYCQKENHKIETCWKKQ